MEATILTKWYVPSRSNDNWATPKDLYDNLNKEFHFDHDPCPLDPNGSGGLLRDWGNSTFVNPPYSKPLPWVKKAFYESTQGKTVVMLLKGDTSTKWFHDWVLNKAEIRFVKGRLSFSDIGRATFPSIIAVYRPDVEHQQKGQEADQ